MLITGSYFKLNKYIRGIQPHMYIVTDFNYPWIGLRLLVQLVTSKLSAVCNVIREFVYSRLHTEVQVLAQTMIRLDMNDRCCKRLKLHFKLNFFLIKLYLVSVKLTKTEFWWNAQFSGYFQREHYILKCSFVAETEYECELEQLRPRYESAFASCPYVWRYTYVCT